MGMYMRVRTSARLRMRIPAQIHIYEGARPRALPEGLGFPVEKIEDMSAGEAEEHIAASSAAEKPSPGKVADAAREVSKDSAPRH